MKFLTDLLLIAGIGLFLNHMAHADGFSANVDIEVHQKGSRVLETELTLLGSGIINPRTLESLVVACVGDRVSPNSFERKCDRLQFVLFSNQRDATWYSSPFGFGSEKAYKNKMKYLEYQARAHFLDPDARNIVGCLLAFGSAGVAVATISTGAGVIVLGAALIGVRYSKQGWQGIDFLSPIPRLLVDSAAATPFRATASKDGWNWSSHPIKMRAKKFERVKELLLERE
jgi:hypothetical protein